MRGLPLICRPPRMLLRFMSLERLRYYEAHASPTVICRPQHPRQSASSATKIVRRTLIRRIFSAIGFALIVASFIGILLEPQAFFLAAVTQLMALIFLLPSAHSLTILQRRAFRVALVSVILMLMIPLYSKAARATIISKYHSATAPAAVAELDVLDRRMFFVILSLMCVTQTSIIFSSWYLFRCCWHSDEPAK